MPSIDFSASTGKPHEQHLASRRAYDGHILHLRVDDVRLPSGRESVREIVEHPGSVIVLPVTVDREILFIRQYRYVIGKSVIELPAGLIDAGEAPDVAAVRELHEETGYRAGNLRFLGAAFISPGYTQERSHFYVATGCELVDHEPDQDEPIELVHVPLDDLPDLLRAGESPVENAQALLALNWFAPLQGELMG
jgi:ADP-ribose pyrophosphatase